MRVISGCAKGHKLVVPQGMNTRPTTDRIKETLFNIISADVYDSRVLDIFCGSGAIGIEALSRNASIAYFVDNETEALNALGQNLAHTKLKEKAVVLGLDAIYAIKKLGVKEEKFDIIFLDPPYAAGLYVPVLEAILKAGVLSKTGIIIAEQNAKEDTPLTAGLKLTKEKKFGTTKMSFWSLED